MQFLTSFQIDRIDDDVVVQVICIGVSDDGELVALFAEKLPGQFDAYFIDFARRKMLRFFRAERQDIVVVAAPRRFAIELLHLVELFAEIVGSYLRAINKTTSEFFVL